MMVPVSVRQRPSQIFPRVRLRIPRQLLRGPRAHHFPARVSALRPHIDHPVRRFDHIQIVLDDQHRRAALQQFPERRQQLLNIVKVQPRRRLVENIKDAGVL